MKKIFLVGALCGMMAGSLARAAPVFLPVRDVSVSYTLASPGRAA